MTLRAFIVGLLAVIAFSLLDAYSTVVQGYGWIATDCFPAGVVFIVVLLTVVGNVLIKLVRRRWAFRQAELMLVWCMLIVSVAFTTAGTGRMLTGMISGGTYLAKRPDIAWETDGSVSHAPADLVLSKDINSEAVRQFYEGTPGGRVPWRRWLVPLAHWGAFLLVLYLGMLFALSILRRQWVDVERLMFPLARVPLEFTQGNGDSGLLPAMFARKHFVIGLTVAAGFRLARAFPVIAGASRPWQLTVPLQEAFAGTPLEAADFHSFPIAWTVVGLAYLVPADVSLSVWFFFLFGRMELIVADRLALPEAGGTWSPLMRWQQFGAYLAFLVGMLWMARRHLAGVVRRAFRLKGGSDDSDEPVPYAVAFWGLVVCLALCMAWYLYHGMRPLTAVVVLGLILCSHLVYARIVAQGGLPMTRNLWVMHRAAEGLIGAESIGPQGALIATIQSGMLVTWTNVVLAPMAANALRISEVFKKRRRLLVPALFAALVVALAVTSWLVVDQAYDMGAANFSAHHTASYAYGEAHRIIEGRSAGTQAFSTRPIAIGAVLMGLAMFMRARFYWWPMHAIGLLTCSSWHIHRLWFPFFLGWLVKVGLMKLVGGRALRFGRDFFIGFIITEAFFSGASAVLRILSAGAVPRF